MTPTATTNSSQLSRQEINQKQKEFIFPSVTTYYSDPVPMDHALMQHVWDVDGKKYLDFFGGIVTISVGHCNPRVISRTKAQIDRLQHVSTCFPNEPMVTLAEKLAQITPGTPPHFLPNPSRVSEASSHRRKSISRWHSASSSSMAATSSQTKFKPPGDAPGISGSASSTGRLSRTLSPRPRAWGTGCQLVSRWPSPRLRTRSKD